LRARGEKKKKKKKKKDPETIVFLGGKLGGEA
jgi:hypothetical protein